MGRERNNPTANNTHKKLLTHKLLGSGDRLAPASHKPQEHGDTLATGVRVRLRVRAVKSSRSGVREFKALGLCCFDGP